MEITYLGLSCVRLRGRDADVLVDPLPAGARAPRLSPDIVVATEGAAEPALLRGAEGRPQTVRGPGEYELRGVRVDGIDAGGGVTIMRVEVDDVRVVAVGRLRGDLSEETVDAIGHVDVLAVPVGGGDALNAVEAARLVNALEPAYVVPVRYAIEGIPGDFEPVERFAKEMGLAEGWTPQPKINLTGSVSNVEETRVVVLEARLAG
ncbi:MAG TPA: MBL fold metallo-hydrolase [Candidatus Dormibacteraeota bacterium]